MEVRTGKDIEDAFKEATKMRVAALAVPQSALFNSNQKRIVDLAAKNRLPAIYSRRDYVESGGLCPTDPTG
jgi:putative tryptophan/tyrosine transport system substrate-binding protein